MNALLLQPKLLRRKFLSQIKSYVSFQTCNFTALKGTMPKFYHGHNSYQDNYQHPNNYDNGPADRWDMMNGPAPIMPFPQRVNCGELRRQHVGLIVELAGKVHKVRMNRFMLLRDAHGITQVVAPDDRPDLKRRFSNIPLQSYIAIRGRVNGRPPGARNEKLTTGQVEVCAEDVLMVKIYREKNPPLPNSQTVRSYSTSASPPSITGEEYGKFNGEDLISLLNKRTVTCADLSNVTLGEKLTLLGWVVKTSTMFITLQDGYGIIQCIVPKDNADLVALTNTLKPQTLLQIEGAVSARPKTQINSAVLNGHIEFVVESLEVLPKSGDRLLPLEYDDMKEEKDEVGVNSITYRTHTCGQLRPSDVGQRVKLCGWLQFQRVSKFLLIRDAYGLMQCTVPEGSDHVDTSNIPLESVLQIEGIVALRPPNSANPKMSTGEVEVIVNNMQIMNKAEGIAFNLRNYQKPKEHLRLQHRYLDLRFPEMQANLRLRSQILHNFRKFLVEEHAFVEVETPTLFCRTPGGAKEFVVPTHHAGQFYSLAQSPQQFKQILMAGGIDRYFQVARCYRDETTRPDRQPEFTQLDIEMSFVDLDGILTLVERLMCTAYPKHLSRPFKRMTYREALETYGSDKPDISFDLKLENVTDILTKYNHGTIDSDVSFGAFAIIFRNGGGKLTTKLKNSIKDASKKYKDVKCYVDEATSKGTLPACQKVFGDDLPVDVIDRLQILSNDTILLAHGANDDCCTLLGEVRTLVATEFEKIGTLVKDNEARGTPLWVVDFPLFARDENGQLESCHHPFTAPHPDDVHLLESDPLKVRSLSFDLVLAGNELGGGSVRAHDPHLQEQLLKMLHIEQSSLEHLMRALKSGCPPHAGIALGIDRLIAVACNAESVRDVIAFPKSSEGRDPLSGAPREIAQEDLEYYSIEVRDKTSSGNEIDVKNANLGS